MAKRSKWNIRAEHEVVFLLLSLLWGLSENVLYLDNYAMLFCYLSIDMILFFTQYSLRYMSLKLDISSIILLLLYKVYGIRFRSEIIC